MTHKVWNFLHCSVVFLCPCWLCKTIFWKQYKFVLIVHCAVLFWVVYIVECLSGSFVLVTFNFCGTQEQIKVTSWKINWANFGEKWIQSCCRQLIFLIVDSIKVDKGCLMLHWAQETSNNQLRVCVFGFQSVLKHTSLVLWKKKDSDKQILGERTRIHRFMNLLWNCYFKNQFIHLAKLLFQGNILII